MNAQKTQVNLLFADWIVLFMVIIFIGLIVFLSGCSTTNQGSTTLSGDTNVVSIPSQPISTINLSLIQAGATVATGAVLQFAEKDSAKRTLKANQLYSSASALYTMTGPSAALATPEQFSSLLTSFGLSQQIAGYASYTASLSSIYASYYQKFTQGSITKQNLSAIVNALAQGVQSGAATYISVPVIPIGTSPQ